MSSSRPTRPSAPLLLSSRDIQPARNHRLKLTCVGSQLNERTDRGMPPPSGKQEQPHEQFCASHCRTSTDRLTIGNDGNVSPSQDQGKGHIRNYIRTTSDYLVSSERIAVYVTSVVCFQHLISHETNPKPLSLSAKPLFCVWVYCYQQEDFIRIKRITTLIWELNRESELLEL